MLIPTKAGDRVASGGQSIEFWKIRKRVGRSKPWELRWRIDDVQKSRSFKTKALAQNHEKDLMGAARAGEAFSPVTGEPVSWAVRRESFYTLARAFVRHQWADSSPGTRSVTAAALVGFTLAHVQASKRSRPDGALLRRALRHWAFCAANDDREPPAEVAAALDWIAAASRPVAELGETAAARALLDAGTRTVDGSASAPSTQRHRRKALSGLLAFAVEQGLLPVNPLAGVRIKRAATVDALNPAQVPDVAQARRLLGVLAGASLARRRHLHAFFALMVYAGCRPGEARALREADLTLPTSGWGRAAFAANTPEVKGNWTDDGSAYEQRQLKHRAVGAVRPVPIPPVLVTILRRHLDVWGTASDGRLFWSGDGFAPVASGAYCVVWRWARTRALSEAELSAGLARRPYDLRHANASLLLNAHVPHTEVARRLGHSVHMLLTTYAHWVASLEESANAQVDKMLGDGPDTGQTAESDPDTGENTWSDGDMPDGET